MIKVSMKQTRGGRRTGMFVALVVLAVLGLAPGAKAACSPSLSQKFLQWKDSGLYTLAPGGSMESSTGWTLSNASIVFGNEPWYVTSSSDTSSLSVPSGAKATSSFMCVNTGYPYFRLFVRNTGSASSKLKVEVLYQDSTGAVKVLPANSVAVKNTSWQPSARLGLASGKVAQSADGTGIVAFRFSPMDSVGKWQVDDLYVDPRRR